MTPRPLRLPLLLVPLLLGTAALAPAAPVTPAQQACLRMLTDAGLSDHYKAACNDALEHPDGPVEPETLAALRFVLEDRKGKPPTEALEQLQRLGAADLARNTDNAFFLYYTGRVLLAPSHGREKAPQVSAMADAIAESALKQESMRAPEQLGMLQVALATAARLRLHNQDEQGAAAWLARLEETCSDKQSCFLAYGAAVAPIDMRQGGNPQRRLASLLADRYGIGDWRTGAAAMALAQLTGMTQVGSAGNAESIYRPFLAEWKKADVLKQQPAAAAWFITIGNSRYERGDYAGAAEIGDYLWAQARHLRLEPIDYRRAADLAINSKIGLRKYAEARDLQAAFVKDWKARYEMNAGAR
ncbi:MAG TPA: hypothetical protein VFV15_05795 [Moraxellaceae bacterium]|nr:hypothetical protein [Moraxellaceae bacterium]